MSQALHRQPLSTDAYSMTHLLLVRAKWSMPPKAYRRFLRDLDKLAASLIASADVPNNVYPIKGGGLPANRTDSAQRGIAIAECLKATLGPAEQPK